MCNSPLKATGERVYTYAHTIMSDDKILKFLKVYGERICERAGLDGLVLVGVHKKTTLKVVVTSKGKITSIIRKASKPS